MFEIGILTFMVLGAGAMVAAGTVLTTKDKEIPAILGKYRENGQVRKAQRRFDDAMLRGQRWHERTTELSRTGALVEVSSRVPPDIADEAIASKRHLHFIRVKEWRVTEAALEPALARQKKQIDAAFEVLVGLMDRYAQTERKIVATAPAGAGVVRINRAEKMRTARLEWTLLAFPEPRERPRRVNEKEVLESLGG